MTEPTHNQPSCASSSLTWAEEWVLLSAVIEHQPLQARKKLDRGAVALYASMTKEGSKPPPIKLAHADGKLYLLDGWHRMAAGALQLKADLSGAESVLALVADMPVHRMPWEAARANVGNGVQYKRAEHRAVFRAFVRSKQHHKSRGVFMSYREMAAALGVGVSHVTLFKWTAAEFPKLAAALAGKEYGNQEAGTYPPEVQTMEEQHNEQAQKALESLNQHAAALGNAVNRWEVLRRLEATADMLRVKGVEHSPF